VNRKAHCVVACKWGLQMHTNFLLEKKLKGRNHSGFLGIDRRIILEWILGIEDGKVWTGFI
jgi:hypothetical protein